MPCIRHFFPGNNTPKGFYSYYDNILTQQEANKIICIKGGPGTGKSTFMKKIGEAIAKEQNVDFLHCSADENSLDGIILKDKKIALVDGTSPHIFDPITPGAVDSILDFGLFWNEENIRCDKEKIIYYNSESSSWYKVAYNYLAAAKKIYDNLGNIYYDGVEISEMFQLAADLIEKDYRGYDISVKKGNIRKQFATGITPTGTISYIKNLISGMDKIYLINVPEGYANKTFMHMITENIVFRGFDVETYYCPIEPDEKIEHLIIPETKTAFVSINKWHDIDPWEIFENEDDSHEIILIDVNDYISRYFLEQKNGLLLRLSRLYSLMIKEGISALSRAKENHDIVEKIYMKNMNFSRVNLMAERQIEKLLQEQ